MSTASSVLEFDGEHLERLYKCYRGDWEEFYDVGVDQISDSLWFFNSHKLQLIKFDGFKWSSQDLPSLPNPDYYSREDINVGFDGFNYDRKFLLVNTARFWKPQTRRAWFYEGGENWMPFDFQVEIQCEIGNPERTVENGCVREIGLIRDELCAVLHGDLIGQDVARGKSFREEFTPQTDIVACKSGEYWRVLNPQGTPDFFSDKIVSRYNSMYTTTRSGKIFRITTTGPELLPTLGEVDALTVSSEGNPLVWFSGKGIYEFNGEWKKLYDVPFEPSSGLKGSLIEENAGTIVVAASPPVTSGERPSSGQAWIMKDGRIVQIL